MNTLERIKAAWAALKPPAASANLPCPSAQQRLPSESPSTLAQLRFDLEAREVELAKVREEYARLERQKSDATETTGREASAALIGALAPVLSQLCTLRHMAEAGREVRAADALKLAAKLEQSLQERGLERIGDVGAETSFNPALHQRMSGGDVRDGDPVHVRFVGYRFAGKTPVKALVSRIGQEHQSE